MLENNTILEFDFSKAENKQSVWPSIFIKLTSILFLVILTSYQDPSIKVQNFQVPYQAIDLQLDLQNKVYSIVENSDLHLFQSISWKLNELVKVFYEQRDFQPVWTNDLNPNTHFNTLINLLDSAKYYGFPHDYFQLESIKSLKSEFVVSKSLESRNILELATTYSAFKFMLYLNRGIVDNKLSFDHVEFLESLPDILSMSFSQNSLRSNILALQPDLVQFKRIVNSLPNFIDLHLSIKFTTPKFIDDRMLSKALYYAGISETADFDTIEINSRAISKIQEQYNLPKYSILDSSTHQVLVSLLEYRYYQASLNLHRLRTLQNTEENFLFVNIPEFRLHIVESKQEKETFNVIVGKKETPTPVFSSNIEKVVTNPYWTVPKSIASDMIPKIRKDSTYLQRNGFYVINASEQIVDMSAIDWNSPDPLGSKYCLRQKNSPSNALGLVKFVFPNVHSVYIHDTPSRGLFNEKNRTFSHGCIRLENPDKLAQYLTDKFYSESSFDIKDMISTNNSNEINLKESVKIHIQYITCSGKENADMEFYSDIYNLDRNEISAIFPVQLEI
jgi:murein L,D-transpeptidase YcbB/YkuD